MVKNRFSIFQFDFNVSVTEIKISSGKQSDFSQMLRNWLPSKNIKILLVYEIGLSFSV